ncbi:hypothetical protein N3K66_007294 [Trichothecium roseum]|uniref:Uncharacterized protein n=1 Tax=Trichothecium roseum TaxID=47278 RepID=A0ACC0UTK5_9HYPO|nr:hypothetical protein N3K66_007294 [Trichothecium roseum]
MAYQASFTLGRTFRNVAMRAGPAACISGGLLMRQTTLRMDASIPAASGQFRASSRSRISPKTVQHISSGSIAGFGTGLILTLFSRTLVFICSVLTLSCYVASRYGVNLPRILGMKKLLDRSAVWAKTGKSPYFTASFTLTFVLAAFVRL